jgi:hypothetical protein
MRANCRKQANGLPECDPRKNQWDVNTHVDDCPNGITRQAPWRAQQITIQEKPTNTANVYIGDHNLVKATLAGCARVLVSGAVMELGYGSMGIQLDDLFGDTDTANNVLLITLVG